MKSNSFLSISLWSILLFGFLCITACNKENENNNIYKPCCSYEPQFLEKGEKYFAVANVFTPNRDGINDIFLVMSNEPFMDLNISLRIFDLDKQLVYESNNVGTVWESGWDGKITLGSKAGSIIEGPFEYNIQISNMDGDIGTLNGFACAAKNLCDIKLRTGCVFSTQYDPFNTTFNLDWDSADYCIE